MRAKAAQRLGAIRLLLAAMKQREVDERIELNDADIVAIIDKMLKQRKDSISQFEAGGRPDLAANERFEMEVLQAYMPQPLTAAEIEQLVNDAIASTGAQGASGIGKVMAAIRPKLAGRADMAQVSALIKSRLNT